MKPLLIEKHRGPVPRYYIRYRLHGRQHEPGLTDRHGQPATKANAAQCYALACKLIAEGHHPTASKASITSWIDEYCAALALKPYENAPDTIDGKRQTLEFFARWSNERGKKRVADLSTKDLEAYQTHRSGLGAASWRREAAYLKHAFKWAVNAGMLRQSPALTLTAKKPKKSSTFLKETISPEEHAKLLAHMPAPVALAWRFCMEIGCRPKEMRVLTVERLNLKRRIVLYRQTKTGEPRFAELSQALATDLAPYLKGRKPTDLVFLTPVGSAWKKDTWREAVYRAGGKAGIMEWDAKTGRASGRKINPHLARHTFATELAEKGLGVRELMDLMGWEDEATALKYVHANQAKMRAAVGAIQSKFSGGRVDAE